MFPQNLLYMLNSITTFTYNTTENVQQCRFLDEATRQGKTQMLYWINAHCKVKNPQRTSSLSHTGDGGRGLHGMEHHIPTA
mmetsp:Transcript_138442/g.240771  ORF Transcript_138442/g.240771 Transcript_138442/m.240771 type:complete len:81 (+) Transcript_138442:1180-1422(+)